MQKKRWLLALGCVCLLTLWISPAAADVDADIDQIFRRAQTVGGAVLVARHGELVYERYYGFANVKEQKPVHHNTYFRAASVTKFISGIGAMRLIEDGLLDLDQDIGLMLGMDIRNPRHRDTPVTLRQLMTHTSGVNDNTGYTHARGTLRAFLEENPRRYFSSREPGKTFVYSNFGAGIVGALMEAASGQSVNAYMAEHVFAPMGIDAAYSASLLRSPYDVPCQYEGTRVDISARRALSAAYEDWSDPNRHYRTTIGALWIRPRDLLDLMSLMCMGGELNGVRLLEPETVALMIAPQSGVGSVTGRTHYGLMTARVDSILPGVTLYGHQGSSSGFITSAYFDPETGYAFVLMTNGASQRQDRRIHMLARRLITYTYPMVVGN
ncbi:MAG: beta-lactamase family protein [Clostridia bacterium]|nr:beta-lactamase family protein [Clostridia bacterium]